MATLNPAGYAFEGNAARAAKIEIWRLLGPKYRPKRKIDYDVSILEGPRTYRYAAELLGKAKAASMVAPVTYRLQFKSFNREWKDRTYEHGAVIEMKGPPGMEGWMNSSCAPDYRWIVT